MKQYDWPAGATGLEQGAEKTLRNCELKEEPENKVALLIHEIVRTVLLSFFRTRTSI